MSKKYRVTATLCYDVAVEIDADNETQAQDIAYERIMVNDDYDQKEFGESTDWQCVEIEENENG